MTEDEERQLFCFSVLFEVSSGYFCKRFFFDNLLWLHSDLSMIE